MSEAPGTELLGDFDASGLRVAVVVSSYNPDVTEGLLDGALSVLNDADTHVVRVSGAFELPVVAKTLAESGFDAVVALGAVVEGETDHYEHVSREAAAGLRQVSVLTGVPIGFGVLTVRDADQARARSLPGPDNKGTEAAEAAVRTARLLEEIRRGGPDAKGQ